MINTREITEEYRLAHWAQIMQERAESGLSIKAFCKTLGCHQNAYFYWQRKLRKAACDGIVAADTLPAPGGWSAAVPAGSGTEKVFQTLTIDIGKCRVTADRGTDEYLLAKVCRVLLSL
jgi:transposase-like protein